MCIRDSRQGIGLQAYGQKDPLVEYKMSGFDMFDDMIANIQEDTVRLLFLSLIHIYGNTGNGILYDLHGADQNGGSVWCRSNRNPAGGLSLIHI